MISIAHITELDAPPSAVWHLLTDTTAWPRYTPVRSVVVERPGHHDVNGAGQIRAIRTWAGIVREEVTDFEAERRLCYTLLSGAPVRNYRGAITLEPAGEVTRLEWRINFEATWFMAPFLTVIAKRTVRKTMRGLAQELRSIR